MRRIKTREAVRDVKALDRAATAAERMKDAFVRTKDSAERTQVSEHDSPSGYAIDKIKGKAEDAAREAVYQAENLGGKAFHKARDTRRSHKEVKQAVEGVKDTLHHAQKSAHGAKSTADGVCGSARGAKDTANGAEKSASGVREPVRNTSRSTKTAADLSKDLMRKRAQDTAKRSRVQAQKSVGRTIGQSTSSGVKSTTKGSVRTARKSIKTAETTAKTTVKTTQRTAQAARKTAQAAAKAAKRAAQATRAATRATIRAVKIAIRVLITTVKAIIAATKALITAIAAGGWVAVAVILIICMVALLICSVFGIFFSSEDGVSENGVTMKTVVSQINTEFAGELARIQRENPHDRCEITANRALWKEILAVYAVRTNTDSDNPLDVITIDEEKIELLRTVFWDMNIIDYWIETIEHTGTSEDEDTWYEYIKLNDLVPDLLKMADDKKIAFTPAVELSFIKPKKPTVYCRCNRGPAVGPITFTGAAHEGTRPKKPVTAGYDRRYYAGRKKGGRQSDFIKPRIGAVFWKRQDPPRNERYHYEAA